MPVNKPEDFTITFRQLHGSNFGGTFESGKTGGLHPNTISEGEHAMKSSRFALWGNFARLLNRLTKHLRKADVYRGLDSPHKGNELTFVALSAFV